MLLYIGWTMVGIEFLLLVICGLILKYVWSHSVMEKSVARTALIIFVAGGMSCIALSVLLPL